MSHPYIQDPFIAALFAQGEKQKNQKLARAGQKTLGELIDFVEALNEEELALHVVFDSGLAPGNPHSYRGYYSDLAFEQGGDPLRGINFLELLHELDGQTFQGWKGGYYTMDRSTFVWQSNEGGVSGIGIVALRTDLEAQRLVLVTAVTD